VKKKTKERLFDITTSSFFAIVFLLVLSMSVVSDALSPLLTRTGVVVVALIICGVVIGAWNKRIGDITAVSFVSVLLGTSITYAVSGTPVMLLEFAANLFVCSMIVIFVGTIIWFRGK